MELLAQILTLALDQLRERAILDCEDGPPEGFIAECDITPIGSEHDVFISIAGAIMFIDMVNMECWHSSRLEEVTPKD